MKEEVVKAFWEWLAQNCNSLATNYENEYLLKEIDQWVDQLGRYNWEVGPGKNKENAFTISPNGDPDLLESTKKIVSRAIPCLGWEFFYAKQPKDWDMVFYFQTNEGGEAKVDANYWMYVLLEYEDGMFDIVIKADDILKLDESDRITAAEILLDGIIGEEVRINKICGIEIVSEFEDSYQGKESNISRLKNYIKRLS